MITEFLPNAKILSYAAYCFCSIRSTIDATKQRASIATIPYRIYSSRTA